MTKRLEITPKIAAEIKRSTDGAVDPSSVAVFETIALNTLPISQKGGLFDRAVTTENTLRQMAAYLNTGTNYAPLHQLHDQGSVLPIGRVFYGEVSVNESGNAELRNLFYLPLTEVDLIAKLDSAVIEEVSVGIRTKHINCSECGWDYKGEDATFSHIWSRTCENGHEIGKDGVHTRLSELESYLEQSLVSRGAANNARILSRTRSLLGAEKYDQLAASGLQPETTILFTSPTKTKGNPMDLQQLIAEMTTVKANLQVKEAAAIALQASIDALTKDKETLSAEVATLKAADTPAEVQVKLQAAEASLTDATAFIREEADRLSVAASLAKPDEKADLATLKAAIQAGRTKIGSELKPGSTAIGATTKPAGETFAPASFKTR